MYLTLNASTTPKSLVVMPMARLLATSRRVRRMWRGRDLCRGVYRKLSRAWQREEACHILIVWAASHLSYPVDRDPCYQFEWSLGKCYFKNLYIYIYILDYQQNKINSNLHKWPLQMVMHNKDRQQTGTHNNHRPPWQQSTQWGRSA